MKAINTAKAPAAIGTYSQAIKKGEWLFLSGQLGLDPKTMLLIENDVRAQAVQAFNNLSAVLEEANGTLAQIVKLTVYLKDLNDFAIFNDVMQTFFHPPFPARAVVQVSRLPRDALVEIEAIATL
jgi:2-iminobutanoate/2-iminopropanoate deaminase